MKWQIFIRRVRQRSSKSEKSSRSIRFITFTGTARSASYRYNRFSKSNRCPRMIQMSKNVAKRCFAAKKNLKLPKCLLNDRKSQNSDHLHSIMHSFL